MRIAILLHPCTVVSSAVNLLDVLHSANRLEGRTVFETCLISYKKRSVEEFGIILRPQAGLEALASADLVVVPAVRGSIAQVQQFGAPFREELASWHADQRQIASICAGAQVLADAGILDGRRATTFWGDANEVRAAFPKVQWSFDQMVEQDGSVLTSAGGSAGIDLALLLVEQTLGTGVARKLAANMLFDYRRGPQNRFFPLLPAPVSADQMVAQAQQTLRQHFAEPPDVPSLAHSLHTSPRNLLRRFKAETGLTLQAYLMRLKLEAARHMLEEKATVEQAVEYAGYVDRASFSRAFKAHYGVSPAAFRSTRRESEIS